MSDKPTKTANYEATKLSASELADWLTGFANQNEGGLVDYEHANMLEIARRLDAMRWRDADPPPTDGRTRWVATALGAEEGYYDPEFQKWVVRQNRPLSARERWYDDVKVVAYLDWFRPPIEPPAYEPEREVRG